MNTKWIETLSLLLGTALLASCATPPDPMQFKPHTFERGGYVPKIDNFQVIIDASHSMNPKMRGEQGYPTARNFVSSLNQSIPADLAYNAGLRSFGHSPAQSKELTALVYGMTRYTRAGFAEGLDSVKRLGGNSPLDAALKAAGEDLKSAPGKSAIVVVSDGTLMEDAPAAAAKVKADLGEKLCIYTVQVGDNPEGKKTLEAVANAGQCGTAVTAAALTDPGKFDTFVKQVFLAGKPVAAAPPPPPGDSDGDGVTDDRDKCPNTLQGAMVDKDGCELKYTMQIEFAFDKAEIPPGYHDQLAEAAAFIKRYPTTQILVAGHTDSTGEEIYNIELSMRRAEAVKTYLIENFGVDGSRLFPRGFGESRPAATNDTAEGRQENRRVDFICCVVIPEQ